MELTLNLFWLLLMIPALWVWHQASLKGAHKRTHSLRCLLIVGGIMMVLFPVVSATDDLQMMRPEVEETGTRNRSGSSYHGKLSASPDDPVSSFAILAAPFRLHLTSTVVALAVQSPVAAPVARTIGANAGRAPPDSSLA
jgi:hypothetical protein